MLMNQLAGNDISYTSGVKVAMVTFVMYVMMLSAAILGKLTFGILGKKQKKN